MILLLTHADTELLALRTVSESLPPGFPGVRGANPGRLATPPDLHGVDAVVVRLLGGRRAWQDPFDALADACAERGTPLLAFGGEAWVDAELAAASTVPPEVLARAFEYLAHGGLENTENLLRFVADTCCGTGFGFADPLPVPSAGMLERPRRPGEPTIGVVFYRAHLLSGNTRFVEDLCDAIEARGARAVAVWCYSLRPDGPGAPSPAIEMLRGLGVDAVVTTVLAAGSLDEASDTWDESGLASLGVPVLQAMAATTSSEAWASSPVGLVPTDVAMGVALPEMDGRLVGVPLSFKELVDDGEELGAPVTAYRGVADRVDRVAGLAVRLALLRRRPPAERRVALVLSAYPTKRSRLGNAVGLDTPASVIELLEALRRAGYQVGTIPSGGDELMAMLADGLTYDLDSADLDSADLDGAALDSTAPQGAAAPHPTGPLGSLDAESYAVFLGSLDPTFAERVCEQWGPPPGEWHVRRDRSGSAGELVFSGLDLGGVLVAIQPPRGFGEDPVAVYHSPELPPTHHYLAFYRWLDSVWGADAVVHVGKHGTLEWLPGKAVGLSGGCAPDAVLGDMPLVYPFVVNDPGEGTQAKRRAHAVIVDHLVPPLTRADTYDDLARLESLLDQHYQATSLDPAKLRSLRREIWGLLVRAGIHRDLGLPCNGDPEPGPGFDDLLVEVDGYLCELKDAQIRGGLHTLGQAPSGEAELDMVLAMTRLPQGRVPSLRAAVAREIGVDLAGAGRRDLDRVEAECRWRLEAAQAGGWSLSGDVASDPTLRWVCDTLVPSLRATSGEVDAVLSALDGRHVPSGPSGAPSRGMAHALPTGRNFYSLDPRAVPSRQAWEVGFALAEAVCARHLADEGRYPETVGLVVWGTSAMRTAGDDVAEALALMGIRPVWAEESGRVTGLEAIDQAELGRPRIDVTVRISGFFRDAFPHVVRLLDQAAELAAGLAEGPARNFVASHGRADPRVFGPPPGAYGSGILALLESGAWDGDDDLADVYMTWGGYSYGRAGMGVPAPEAMRRRFAAIDVAVKNQDNREHDIFDSDDYLQDHGGMVATVRALVGAGRGEVRAYFGDSADPARPRVRTLAQEAARVVRTRVLNPKWLSAMQRHGYKGAFEMAATVDYLFGYDVTAHVAEDWMYEGITEAYVADPSVRKFFERSNPWALRSIAERLLEAQRRGLWDPSPSAVSALRSALLEAEGWEEAR